MKRRFLIFSIILLASQILLGGVLELSPYFALALLPVVVLCLPVQWSIVEMMLTAFLLGFLSDFFSTGSLGLECLALVPVAFVRNLILEITMGQGFIDRQEPLSFRRSGPIKMGLAIMMAYAVYFIIFIWVDGAGMRTFWFNAGRFLLSWSASVLIAVPVSSVLTKSETSRWK